MRWMKTFFTIKSKKFSIFKIYSLLLIFHSLFICVAIKYSFISLVRVYSLTFTLILFCLYLVRFFFLLFIDFHDGVLISVHWYTHGSTSFNARWVDSSTVKVRGEREREKQSKKRMKTMTRVETSRWISQVMQLRVPWTIELFYTHICTDVLCTCTCIFVNIYRQFTESVKDKQ